MEIISVRKCDREIQKYICGLDEKTTVDLEQFMLHYQYVSLKRGRLFRMDVGSSEFPYFFLERISELAVCA